MDLLTRRFADKPNQMSAAQLPILDMQGGWIATAKLDGFRCMVVVRDTIEFFSRVWKPLPICKEIRDAIASLGLPQATVLDTEWTARRPGHQGKELLYLIGIPWYHNEWLGVKPESDRWALTVALSESYNQSLPIKLPKWTDKDYSQLFEWSKTDTTTEGIVLKRKDSKLIGDLHINKHNPSHIKIKWRGGISGDTII